MSSDAKFVEKQLQTCKLQDVCRLIMSFVAQRKFMKRVVITRRDSSTARITVVVTRTRNKCCCIGGLRIEYLLECGSKFHSSTTMHEVGSSIVMLLPTSCLVGIARRPGRLNKCDNISVVATWLARRTETENRLFFVNGTIASYRFVVKWHLRHSAADVVITSLSVLCSLRMRWHQLGIPFVPWRAQSTRPRHCLWRHFTKTESAVLLRWKSLRQLSFDSRETRKIHVANKSMVKSTTVKIIRCGLWRMHIQPYDSHESTYTVLYSLTNYCLDNTLKSLEPWQ